MYEIWYSSVILIAWILTHGGVPLFMTRFVMVAQLKNTFIFQPDSGGERASAHIAVSWSNECYGARIWNVSYLSNRGVHGQRGSQIVPWNIYGQRFINTDRAEVRTRRPLAHHRRGISNPPVSPVMRESKIKNSEITTKDYRIPPGSLLLICRKLSIFVE